MYKLYTTIDSIIQDCIMNAYAVTAWGHWFNCFCGSTLLIKVQVINYQEFNKVIVNDPANTLNYKKGA